MKSKENWEDKFDSIVKTNDRGYFGHNVDIDKKFFKNLLISVGHILVN
jgi:hypothetical protein